ncbi:UNVERIFIED_CONTAM: hypothetical protein FKN15_074498 [Acipenser sinensis]
MTQQQEILQSGQPSPASSSASSSSGSSFTPPQNRQVSDFICRKAGAVPVAAHTVLGPLRSIMQDLHSDDNEEDSEEEEDEEEEDDNDNDSDVERPVHMHMTHRNRRVSLSDGSDSDNSAASSPPAHREPPPLLKTSKNQDISGYYQMIGNSICTAVDRTRQKQAYLDELVELHKRLMTLREGHILQQMIEVKSPIKQTKPEKTITNMDCDTDISGYYQMIGNSICTAVDRTRQKQAYLDELVELHKRLMTLREGHILQQDISGYYQMIGNSICTAVDRTRQKQAYLDELVELHKRLMTLREGHILQQN